MKILISIYLIILTSSLFGQQEFKYDSIEINLAESIRKGKEKSILVNDKRIATLKYKCKTTIDSVVTYIGPFTMFDIPEKKISRGVVLYDLYIVERTLDNCSFFEEYVTDISTCYYFVSKTGYSKNSIAIVVDSYKFYFFNITKIKKGKTIYLDDMKKILNLPKENVKEIDAYNFNVVF